MQHRDVIYISSIVLSTDLPSSRVRSSPSLVNSVDGPSIRQWKGKSRLDFPVVPAVEAKFFFLLIAIWTSKNMYIYIFFFTVERCKWHGERRFEEGRHGDLGSSIESNLGHERRAFCLSLNAARPSSFTRIRDSNARPGRAIYHTEALRPIRGAFLVVRKRRDTWGFTIESRNRLRILFVDRCRSMGGRCGTGRKERKNCCCREGDLENCADCERRLTRRLKMFAKSRETGAEEVERYLLRCYS